jgi:hypothetical protein
VIAAARFDRSSGRSLASIPSNGLAARHPRKSLSQSDADTKHREPAANIAAVI